MKVANDLLKATYSKTVASCTPLFSHFYWTIVNIYEQVLEYCMYVYILYTFFYLCTFYMHVDIAVYVPVYEYVCYFVYSL